MNLKDIETFVGMVSYKPNYKLRFNRALDADVCSFYATALVPDSYHPERTMPITTWRTLSVQQVEAMDEETLLNYIKWIFQEMEMHELDEWFKFAGVLVNNPHPPIESKLIDHG